MIDSVSGHLQQYWIPWLFAFVVAVLAVNLLLEIEAIISAHGAQIAFPSRTVHVHGDLADNMPVQEPVGPGRPS